MGALIRYHISYYIKSSKFVMPLLTFFLYLVMAYTTPGKTVPGSMVLSVVVLYFLMVWVGFVYSDCENSVSEQLLLLKAKSMNAYYISKILFLFLFGCFMSVLAVLVPIIWNIVLSIGGSSLFQANSGGLCVLNVLQMLLAHIFGAFLGAMVGYVFQPRVFKNRILIIIVAFLWALMGLIKISIEKDVPFLKFIFWIFPPISSIASINGDSSVVGMSGGKSNGIASGTFFMAIAFMAAYGIIMAIINVISSKKKGF